jgi:two-component system NtrC family sensor kinase
MKKKLTDYLKDFFNSLSFKIFMIISFLLVILVSLYITLGSRLQTEILEDTVGQAIYRQSDLIKKSLYRLMLLNEREELYKTILAMGNEPGVESIRIYNKKGEIKFSVKETETGQIVDMKAEACFACHAANEAIRSLPMQRKTRIFTTADERRVMGMINPIGNAPECSNASCHAHSSEQTILGVLDVQMSLNELDQAVSKARSLFYVILTGTIFLTTVPLALVIYFTIYKPIRTLEMGTATLAGGDLDHRIKMHRRDELGILAKSFNNMASNLKRAYTELKEWSDQLEERVKEKTEEIESMHQGMLQVEKMASLGKMAASVAHELNNPIAGILTLAKLLQKQAEIQVPNGEKKEKIMHELDLIQSESMRCGNIVRNLLTFARGKSANFQECSVDEVIEKALQILNHHFELAKIEANSTVEIQPAKIVCDPEQLLQALIAILVNASEAMTDGGSVDVIVRKSPKDPGYVVITVKDTGIGISDDVKDKILEPFFSTKEDKGSVGLGLAEVYGIVQRHKGKIRVESAVGEGTTVILELPIDQENGKGD